MKLTKKDLVIIVLFFLLIIDITPFNFFVVDEGGMKSFEPSPAFPANLSGIGVMFSLPIYIAMSLIVKPINSSIYGKEYVILTLPLVAGITYSAILAFLLSYWNKRKLKK